jgi:hypothetical protein
MLTWYNRRFVEGMNDSRVSVAPPAEHDSMDKADLNYSRKTPIPSFGRRMAQLRITS